MALELQLIKHHSGILIPATPETSDILQSKTRLGDVLVAEFRRVRNPAFHRRFFALLNLGFEYWEPTGGAISSNERKLITGYRNSADYEDSVWFCGQVQPYMTGLDTGWRDHLEKKGVKIGSRSPLLLPKEGSFGYAQAQPNMLAKEAMDSKRDYMVQLGARLIEQNATAKTATQASGEQTSSTSVLGICVSNVSEAYTLALGWCAKYLGIKGESTSYTINQEFIAKVAESGMVTAIVNAWQSGALRDSDMIRALQKLDLIDPADSPDEVIDALRNQAPTLTGG